MVTFNMAEDILRQELTSIPLPLSPFFTPVRTMTMDKKNWQYLLKSAIFRSFSQYTGFTTSLDMKMEADSLLWEKIDEAKFIIKTHKTGSKEERSGILLDRTRETGHLEVVQVEKSIPEDHRILAFWKVKILDPDQAWIQIKIGRNPSLEHTYQYLPGVGLEEVKSKDSIYNKSQNSKQNLWKNSDNPISKGPVKRQDHYVIRMEPYDKNNFKIQRPYYRPKAGRTIILKPTQAQYYQPYRFEYHPTVAPQKYSTWRQEGAYYPANQVQAMGEFKQATDYSGFVPSMGPRASPQIYETSVQQPQYRIQPNYYTPVYSTEPVPTYKPYQIAYRFKPSTQFVQYSEPDPFYNSEPEGSVEDTANSQPIEYEQIPSVSEETPQVVSEQNLYENTAEDIETTEQNKEISSTEQNTTEEEEVQTEILKDKQFSTTAMTKATTETSRGRYSPRSPHTSSLRGRENNEYTPLYIRWGQKIKPADNRTKSEEKLLREEEMDKPGMEEEVQKISEEKNDGYNNATEYRTEKINTTEISVTTEAEVTTTEAEDLTTTLTPDITDAYDYNRTGKTPEEIVHELTTLGLAEANNSTTATNANSMGSEEVRTMDQLVEDLDKLLTEASRPPPIDGKGEDSQKEASEPVSMVINKISKSVTYRISPGGTVKQHSEKT